MNRFISLIYKHCDAPKFMKYIGITVDKDGYVNGYFYDPEGTFPFRNASNAVLLPEALYIIAKGKLKVRL